MGKGCFRYPVLSLVVTNAFIQGSRAWVREVLKQRPSSMNSPSPVPNTSSPLPLSSLSSRALPWLPPQTRTLSPGGTSIPPVLLRRFSGFFSLSKSLHPFPPPHPVAFCWGTAPTTSKESPLIFPAPICPRLGAHCLPDGQTPHYRATRLPEPRLGETLTAGCFDLQEYLHHTAHVHQHEIQGVSDRLRQRTGIPRGYGHRDAVADW